MSNLINPLPERVIVEPVTGDKDRAEDILMEIQAILRKHDCVLMMARSLGQPNEMILAKVTDPAMYNCRVIAGVKDISPFAITWRKIEARKVQPQ